MNGTRPILKAVDAVTLLIVIVGGINWGLIGLFDFNMLTVIFAPPEDQPSPSLVAQIAYVVVGLAAVWQAGALLRSLAVRDG